MGVDKKYRCFYPHWSRDPVSPVCGTFTISAPSLKYFDLNKGYFKVLLSYACKWQIQLDCFFAHFFRFYLPYLNLQNLEYKTMNTKYVCVYSPMGSFGYFRVLKKQIEKYIKLICKSDSPIII